MVALRALSTGRTLSHLYQTICCRVRGCVFDRCPTSKRLQLRTQLPSRRHIAVLLCSLHYNAGSTVIVARAMSHLLTFDVRFLRLCDTRVLGARSRVRNLFSAYLSLDGTFRYKTCYCNGNIGLGRRNALIWKTGWESKTLTILPGSPGRYNRGARSGVFSCFCWYP